MDNSICESTDISLLEVLPDKADSDPAIYYQEQEMLKQLETWLDKLMPKEADILARRFGLRGHESVTLEEVGGEIGLTRERVRQIQIAALKKLRQMIEQEGLSLEAVARQD